MKQYDILDSVILAFLSAQDHYDAIITSKDGHLGFDGRNILLIQPDGELVETITTNNAIQIWLEQGRIKERTHDSLRNEMTQAARGTSNEHD